MSMPTLTRFTYKKADGATATECQSLMRTLFYIIL